LLPWKRQDIVKNWNDQQSDHRYVQADRSPWLQPKFSSFDQMSFTLIGFTAKGRGACFEARKHP